DDPFVRKTDAPGVVAGRTDELQLAAVGLEAIKALREAKLLVAHGSAVRRIADHAPDPVVQSVAEIARTRVRVQAAIPAGEQLFLHVRLAVAVGVLHEPRALALVHDHATVPERQAGGNVQTFGEDGES